MGIEIGAELSGENRPPIYSGLMLALFDIYQQTKAYCAARTTLDWNLEGKALFLRTKCSCNERNDAGER
jgi:hypothetical protein